ncbi:MAG: hypothetical protein PF436_08395 [Prolixibacteraceae bacterium]|jgi:TM2 domain-containing membrane protein YozV|nr:hypothetical protein [Prolixibacteraceae bacterium]
MTRFINTVFIVILFSASRLPAQENIFDCNNSLRFANYLYNTAQYELAQHEFERLSFFCNLNEETQLALLKTYRKNQQYSKANQFFQTKDFTRLEQMDTDYKAEYIRLMMSQQLYGEVQKAINTGLTFPEKFEHQLAIKLLHKNWNDAYNYTQNNNIPQNLKANTLTDISSRAYASTQKKPWLASLMSVVVPGSGKMYSGYWGDGLISLLFTVSSGFFAYRAFNRYGSDKVYPWIAGGLAVSYYSANIYGGAKAAQRYNENLNHQFIHETERILFSDY